MIEVNYIKLPHHGYKSYCIKVKAVSVNRESEEFLCRIDTGADVTTFPRKHIYPLMPLLRGKYLLLEGFDGIRKRQLTHLCSVQIGEYTYFMTKGVLLREGDHGLLGMDVLQHFNILIVDNDMQLERRSK